MQRILHRSQAAFLAAAWLLTSATPVLAEDIEIYLGSTSSSSATCTADSDPATPDEYVNCKYPNVLFILDDSGSMDEIVDTNANGITDPGEKSRLANMQDALFNLFSTVNNVNVGMGNFSVPGGPILFPVADVNAPLSAVEGAAAVTTTYSGRISSSTDDAEEALHNSSMILNNTVLKLTTNPAVGTVTVTSQPVALLDDAYERRTNGTNEVIDSPYLMMGIDRMDHSTRDVNASGVRFPGLAIPQGKTITRAVLTLTSNADSTQTEVAGSTKIRAQAIDDAPAFVAGTPAAGTAGNITARNRTTASATATISTITPWQSDNNIITFEDPVVGTASSTKLAATGLKDVVQEVVNRAGWSSGNALALLFGGIDRSTPAAPAESLTGSGRFGAYTAASTTKAPILTVTYSTGITNLAQDIGLRFNDVSIPQGATITSAYIEMVPVTTDAGSAAWTILGEDVDNAATYTATAGNIHNRVVGSPTAATVAWAPGGWTAATAVQTPDLTSIVQEIVNRPGWCGNNSMNFMVTGTTGSRPVYSYDGDSTKAPLLVINYTPNSGCTNAVLQRQITQSNQDAESTIASGGASVSSTEFNITSSQINGLYFENMAIAPGTTIQEAYLEFVARASDTAAVTATIRTDVGTFPPAPFAGAANIGTRTGSTASVNWTFSNWTTGSTYRSPDIKTVIQELVNHPSWLSGYAVTLTMTATASQRRAHTLDSSPANAPRLIVKIQGAAAEKTVRTKLIEISNALTPRTFTPIVGYYSEAARYYKGAPVYWGRDRGGYCVSGGCSTSSPYNYPFPSGVPGAISVGMSDSRRYSSLSHFASYTGGTVVRSGAAAACTDSNPTSSSCATEYVSGNPVYRTPILDECQNNYIVLLTDGIANQNSTVDVNQIESWASVTCAGKGTGAAPKGEACGRELAQFLFEEDQNTGFTGTQKVITYTIGFGSDIVGSGADTFLRDMASLGGGAFYLAGDAISLTNVFQSIISSILSVNTGFEAPALSVNNYNRLTNRDELYYALFKPSTQQQWDGNVKKYKLGEDNLGNAAILDVHDAAAVDPATGFFVETAQSFWSTSVDGAEVADGGVADQLPADRNAYTYTGDVGDPPASLPVSLTQTKYQLRETNTSNVTNVLLGIGGTNGDANHQNLLEWARGQDPAAGAEHQQFGDPLHAKPVVVSYVDNPAAVPPLLDQALLTTNNRGYFSIIDPSDGTEKFTWVPKELLPNLNLFYNNTGTVTGNGGKVYGLDGEITLRIIDLDKDNDLRDSGDKVYATFGMRRGGRNYYSIDLNRSATNVYYPNLQWEILGGVGDFAELGQTWSTPKLAKVKFNGTDTDVFFFGGGYDPNQDNVTVRTADAQGRAIYMVNAQTGALLWMAGNDSITVDSPPRNPDLVISTMDYSIPGDIAILDINGDGYTDRLYAGDMGGQVFRFDFANATNTGAGNFASGGRIAELAGNATTSNRRFYYAPDVALMNGATGPYLSVAIGSGFREHPLTNVDVIDRMYVLRDTHILDTVATGSYTTEYSITEANLYDLTTPINTGDATAVANFENAKGWYITMENPGEKVLSKALTFNGFILFSSFDPNLSGAAANVCTTSLGLGRLYIVNAYDASAVLNLNPATTGLDKTDRSTNLDRGGIPPEPVIVFRDTGDPDNRVDPTLLVGTEVIRTTDDTTGENILSSGVSIRKGWWRQDK